MIRKTTFGFTLIELLVVISVIGVLVTLALVSFGPAQKQARDTKRKSDIKQYQASLESFANKAGSFLYPSRTTATQLSSLCTTLGISGTCPEDPKSPAATYQYLSDGSGNPSLDATKYVLWTTLENTTGYWIVCSGGKVGSSTTVPGSATCPI